MSPLEIEQSSLGLPGEGEELCDTARGALSKRRQRQAPAWPLLLRTERSRLVAALAAAPACSQGLGVCLCCGAACPAAGLPSEPPVSRVWLWEPWCSLSWQPVWGEPSFSREQVRLPPMRDKEPPWAFGARAPL